MTKISTPDSPDTPDTPDTPGTQTDPDIPNTTNSEYSSLILPDTPDKLGNEDNNDVPEGGADLVNLVPDTEQPDGNIPDSQASTNDEAHPLTVPQEAQSTDKEVPEEDDVNGSNLRPLADEEPLVPEFSEEDHSNDCVILHAYDNNGVEQQLRDDIDLTEAFTIGAGLRGSARGFKISTVDGEVLHSVSF